MYEEETICNRRKPKKTPKNVENNVLNIDWQVVRQYVKNAWQTDQSVNNSLHRSRF